MVVKVNVLQQNNSEQGWRVWRNTFWFNMANMPVAGFGAEVFKPLWEWHQLTLKQNCAVLLIQWESVGGSGGAGELPTGGVTTCGNRSGVGAQPIGGQMRFMHGLRWRLLCDGARMGQSIWHGCLDDSQLYHVDGERTGLRPNPAIDEIGRFYFNQMQSGELFYQLRVSNPAGVFNSMSAKRVTGLGGPYYSEMHAVTRWLWRLRGKGPQVFQSMLGCLQAMETARQIAANRLTSDGPFTFADIWYQCVAALQNLIVVENANKPYLSDADEKPENGEVPPEVRYGPTCDLIRQAWEIRAEKIKTDVPELIKIHRPFEYAGDEFILREDLIPFVEMIESVLTALASSLSFDWSNYKAYPNQIPESDYKHSLDAVELLL